MHFQGIRGLLQTEPYKPQFGLLGHSESISVNEIAALR